MNLLVKVRDSMHIHIHIHSCIVYIPFGFFCFPGSEIEPLPGNNRDKLDCL